jgi:hypothetical protein
MTLPLTLALFAALAQPASQEPVSTVCIAMPRVEIVQGDAATAASGLRDMFASYLTGPSLKSVVLESRLQSQAMAEARQKQCDRVLITTLSQKRKGGGRFGKIMGEAAGTALWYVPGGTTAGTAAARAAAVAGARAISTVAATTKARDEFTLEYRVEDGTGKPVLPAKKDTMKAGSDGQDLLTPLVEKAAEAVAAAIS